MTTLSPFLIDDHRSCDRQLAAAESHAQAENWDEAEAAWSTFAAHMRCHFAREEEHVFPAFEAATGNAQGPTAVMRMEHEQMRAMIDQLDEAAKAHDGRRFLALTESVMVLCQQHNMKEEQILYPMCDQMIPDGPEVLARITALRPDA